MEHDLRDTVSLLSRTPGVLNALLRDLPETWTLRNEGEKSWSAYDVVGHLIHAERDDWIPRVKMILEFGDTKAFGLSIAGATSETCKENPWRSYWMNLRQHEPRVWRNCER